MVGMCVFDAISLLGAWLIHRLVAGIRDKLIR